jgi:hypothetical protein
MSEHLLLTALAACIASLIGIELMGIAALVSCLAALLAGLAGLFGIELVGVAALMSCLAALACDLPLLFRIHRGETTITRIVLIVVVHCHGIKD